MCKRHLRLSIVTLWTAAVVYEIRDAEYYEMQNHCRLARGLGRNILTVCGVSQM